MSDKLVRLTTPDLTPQQKTAVEKYVRGVTAPDPYSITALGAKGVGDETLYTTSYASDISSSPVTITQQTRDGLAINAAIKALRAAGGGELVFPAGEFTTYGYLERVDFPLRIRGAGRGLTVLRNCSTSPWSDGYGIFCIQPSTLAEISISDMTFDGYATSRSGAVGEKRAYPIGVYGLPKLTIHNVESRNSPIDCFYTNYTNGEVGAYVQASNCLFSNSWRNTSSLVSGWNQQYTNCIFEKGGKVGTGTNPKAVLDIEPNTSSAPIKSITFDNCIFREAVNSVVSGVWAGNVRFNGCTIDAFGGALAGGTAYGFPILTNMQAGEFTFSGCTLKYTNGDYRGTLLGANNVYTGDYGASQFVRYEGCTIEGAGADAYSLNTQFRNCTFKNSLRPFLAGGNNTQNLFIDGLTLTNVFDPTTINAGGGAYSSFFLQSSFEGVAVISNLTIRVDAAVMPSDFLTTLSGTTKAFGILLNASATGKIRLSNIHVDGYYRKVVTAIGGTLSTSNFRDWNVPNLPPADTAGQTTNASTYFYRNCTGYGDAL